MGNLKPLVTKKLEIRPSIADGQSQTDSTRVNIHKKKKKGAQNFIKNKIKGIYASIHRHPIRISQIFQKISRKNLQKWLEDETNESKSKDRDVRGQRMVVDNKIGIENNGQTTTGLRHSYFLSLQCTQKTQMNSEHMMVVYLYGSPKVHFPTKHTLRARRLAGQIFTSN